MQKDKELQLAHQRLSETASGDHRAQVNQINEQLLKEKSVNKLLKVIPSVW